MASSPVGASRLVPCEDQDLLKEVSRLGFRVLGSGVLLELGLV